MFVCTFQKLFHWKKLLGIYFVNAFLQVCRTVIMRYIYLHKYVFVCNLLYYFLILKDSIYHNSVLRSIMTISIKLDPISHLFGWFILDLIIKYNFNYFVGIDNRCDERMPFFNAFFEVKIITVSGDKYINL